MVMGKLQEHGRPTIWMIVGKGLLRVGECLDIFTFLCPFLFLPLSGRRPGID